MRRPPLFALLSILLLHVMVLNVSANTSTYTATPGIAIPDGLSLNCTNGITNSVTTTINVPDSFTITDLDVMLDISHTWVGDIQVQLTSPSSTTVVLIDRPGRPTSSNCGFSANNINTTLDDESSNGSVENADPPTGASYTPENPLSAFDGENSSGVWTLTVIDKVDMDTGVLNSWGLIFTAPPAPPSDADADGDGIPDTADNCPLRGDEGNGVDSNGCPIHVWVRPDDRVNWHHGDLSTVVYSQGNGAAVYCYSKDNTWLAMHITPEIVNNADPDEPQNVPVMEYEQDGCKAAFYILDSGEYQINMWTYEGKRYELISDTLDFSQPTMRYFDPNE